MQLENRYQCPQFSWKMNGEIVDSCNSLKDLQPKNEKCIFVGDYEEVKA
jgi:hypothetical protein